MQVPSSGPVAMSDLRSILGGNNPVYLSQYYSDSVAGYVSGVSGVPASGTAISISSLMGKARAASNIANTTFMTGLGSMSTTNAQVGTGTFNGSTYTVRMSEAPSFGSAGAAFNNSTARAAVSYNTTTGAYTGSTTTTLAFDGGTYAGVWIQLELPTPTSIQSYSFGNGASPYYDAFGSWVLLGSNSGSNGTWILLDSGSQTPTATTVTEAPRDTISKFSYIRLVVTSIAGLRQGTAFFQSLKFSSNAYPPAAVPSGSTSTTINGTTYTFTTGSSTNGGNNANWPFDRDSGTITFFDTAGSYNATTGVYAGTLNTNGVLGAYHQIQMSVGTVITGYQISLRSSGTNQFRSWYVFGSMDGSTWTQLDSYTLSSWPYGIGPVSFSFNNGTAYTYYRFVINLGFNTTAPSIQEFVWLG